MELRVLRYFLTVAREGTASRAAETFIRHTKCFLGMGQPNR